MRKTFLPNKAFWKDYRKARKDNKHAANILLLLCEMADSSGCVYADEDRLLAHFNLRFPDPEINAQINYKGKGQ